MTKTKKRGQPEYNRNYDMGDLVVVFGEDGKVFRIEGCREVIETNNGEEPIGYTEYYVANIDIGDGWWDIAYDEDMSLLAKAADAEKFLRNRRARERRGKRHILTTDDLLSDLHSVVSIEQTLTDGPLKEELTDMKEEIKRRLKVRTGGGRQ